MNQELPHAHDVQNLTVTTRPKEPNATRPFMILGIILFIAIVLIALTPDAKSVQTLRAEREQQYKEFVVSCKQQSDANLYNVNCESRGRELFPEIDVPGAPIQSEASTNRGKVLVEYRG